MGASELHHEKPRYLLRLHREAFGGSDHDRELDGAGIQAWLSWEDEALRYGVPVEVGAEDLAELVESSTVVVPAEEHRNGHSAAGDFARWGRRGGLRTLQLYGSSWFALLALRRWDRITAADLDVARVLR